MILAVFDLTTTFEQADNIRLLLLPLAFAITLIGLILRLREPNIDTSQGLSTIVLFAGLVGIIAVFGQLLTIFDDGFQDLADEIRSGSQYIWEEINYDAEEDFGVIDLLKGGNIFQAFYYAILKAIISCAHALSQVFIFFQRWLVIIAYATSPLMLAFIGIRNFAHVGTTFLAAVIGLLLWPVGFALADIGAYSIFENFTVANSSNSNWWVATGLLAPFIASCWILLSYIAIPGIIAALAKSGGEAGSSLVGGTGSGAMQMAMMANMISMMSFRGAGAAATSGGTSALASGGFQGIGNTGGTSGSSPAPVIQPGANLGATGSTVTGASGGSGGSSGGGAATNTGGALSGGSTGAQAAAVQEAKSNAFGPSDPTGEKAANMIALDNQITKPVDKI